MFNLWNLSFFPQKSSECGSAVSTKSSLSDDEDMGWSFSWPPTVWHCFLKGRRTHTCTPGHSLAVDPQLNRRLPPARDPPAFPPRDQRRVARRGGAGLCRGGRSRYFEGSTSRGRTDKVVEGRAVGETSLSPPLQSYGSEGLQLVEHTEIVLSGRSVLQLTFDPGVFGHTPLTAHCQLDHPFYVKDKGATGRFGGLGRPDVGESLTPPSASSSRLDVLLSQPHRGASWDTLPRTGGGGAVPPAGTQRCQTGRQLGGVRKNQEVKEATADGSVCPVLQDEA